MQVAHAIPPGQVSTFAAIGALLDVVPRQVAYLLARKNDPAREAAPWYRVVPDDGTIGRPKSDAWGRSQHELLAAEGVLLAANGVITDLRERLFTPTIANTGITPTPQPTAAGSTRRSR